MSFEAYLALPIRARGWLTRRIRGRNGRSGGLLPGMPEDLLPDEIEHVTGRDLAALREVFPHALAR